MVPGAGIEPALCFQNRILSPRFWPNGLSLAYLENVRLAEMNIC